MAIKDRNLGIGTRLIGSYKGEQYVCSVEEGEDGKPAYVLAEGERFKSPSAAAGAVMGGKAVNGWLFWTVSEDQPTPKRAASRKSQMSRLIYRLPNQKGMAEGFTRFYCNACTQSFSAPAGETPAACPQGHSADVGE